MSHAKNRMLRLQQVKILLLESGGMGYKELMDKLDVHTATVYRDLEELGASPDLNGIWRYTPTKEDYKLAALLTQAP
jgi:DeoR/GlpR family transcriptional regulator of sugar metabolism